MLRPNLKRRRLITGLFSMPLAGCGSLSTPFGDAPETSTVPPTITAVPAATAELVQGAAANFRAFQGIGPLVNVKAIQISTPQMSLPTFGLKLDVTNDASSTIRWAAAELDGLVFYSRTDLLQRLSARRAAGLEADPTLISLLDLPSIAMNVVAFQMATQESEQLLNAGFFGKNAEVNLARQKGYTMSSIVVTASSSSQFGRGGQGGEARIEGQFLRMLTNSDNASGGVLALSVGGARSTRVFNSPYAALEFLLILAFFKVLSHEMRVPLSKSFLKQDYGLADDPTPIKRELVTVREFRMSEDSTKRAMLAVHLAGLRALCNGGNFGRNPTDLTDMSVAFTRGADSKWRSPVPGVPAVDPLPMLWKLEREGVIRDKFEAEVAMLHVSQLYAAPQLRERVQATRMALNASLEKPSVAPECPAKGVKCPPKGSPNSKK